MTSVLWARCFVHAQTVLFTTTKAERVVRPVRFYLTLTGLPAELAAVGDFVAPQEKCH